jgi:hypothetical protein
MNKIVLICKNCNKEFIVPSFMVNAKYCNHDCYWQSMRNKKRPERHKRKQKDCLVCKKKFYYTASRERLKTCSIKCGGIIRRGKPIKKKERIKKKCIGCNNDIYLLPSKENKIFCTKKCFLSFRSKHVKYPDRQRIQGYKWEKTRKLVIERDKFCTKCGKDGKEVHHIIPYSITADDSLNNLTLLCKSCHLITHMEMWRMQKNNSATAEH